MINKSTRSDATTRIARDALTRYRARNIIGAGHRFRRARAMRAHTIYMLLARRESQMRLHQRAGLSGGPGPVWPLNTGERNVDAVARPGSWQGTYAGQGTQKEEASGSVGDSC